MLRCFIIIAVFVGTSIQFGLSDQSCWADIISITSNVADAESHHSDSTVGALTNPGLLAGGQWTAGEITAVFPFQLPTLGSNEVITNAVASFNYFQYFYNAQNYTTGASTRLTYNASLFGLDAVRSTPTVLGTDWNAPQTLLSANLITPTTSVGTVTSVDLSSWLSAQYASGANAGDYVFLALSGDALPATQKTGYQVYSANGATAPSLTLTTAVPEPSSALSLGIVGGCLAFYRRRRSRRAADRAASQPERS